MARGNPNPKPRSTEPLIVRFSKKIKLVDSGCWEWQGAIGTRDYGVIRINKINKSAHTVSWELFRGSVEDLCVLHMCDNRSCVNPNHLFLGTRTDNHRDMMSKMRHQHGRRSGSYLHGKYVNQMRWRKRSDGSRYYFSGNPEN